MKYSNLFAAVFTAMVSIFMGSCSSSEMTVDEPQNIPEEEEVTPNKREDIVLDSKTRATAGDLTGFYTKFTVDAINTTNMDSELKGSNIVVSPLSVAFMISMVANGVEGTDLDNILEYLGIESVEDLNALSAVLMSELPKVDNQTKMLIANSVWVNDLYNLTDVFQSNMKESYNASVFFEKFGTATVKDKINSWCSDATEEAIPHFLDEVPESMAIFLNAVCFKGKWEEDTFRESDTKKDVFHSSEGDTEVDMMTSVTTERKYFEDANFKVVSLPYGNSAYSMLIVVPKEDSPFENPSLTVEDVSLFYEKLYSAKVTVYLPKFKTESKPKLAQILSNGGLSIIMNERNYTMFRPAQTGILFASHATSFEVNEKGATAAAVSEGEILVGAPLSDGNVTAPKVVKADRPFYFFIREVSTGACVLSGRISKP